MKKLLSYLMIAVLAMTCLVMPAFAAESATISVSTETAAIGGTVTLEVSITEATFASYGMSVEYDAEALELTAIEQGEATKGLFSGNPATGIVGAINDKDSTVSGVLFTLTFKVLTNEVGTYAVEIKIDNVTAADRSDVAVEVTAGAVEVECEHVFGEWEVVTPADCENDGVERRVCTVCGHYETRVIEALGHDFVDGICTRCGAEDPNYETPDTGDTIFATVAVALVSVMGVVALTKKKES